MIVIEINETLTQKVAQLARLELSESELKSFTSQLGEILAYVERLNEIDVEGVEPLTHPLEIKTYLSPDVVRPFPRNSEGKPKTLDCATEVYEESFKVPLFL